MLKLYLDICLTKTMRNLNVIQFRDKMDFLLRNAGKGQLITECRTA